MNGRWWCWILAGFLVAAWGSLPAVARGAEAKVELKAAKGKRKKTPGFLIELSEIGHICSIGVLRFTYDAFKLSTIPGNIELAHFESGPSQQALLSLGRWACRRSKLLKKLIQDSGFQ